jgi:hypothetical protein
MAARVTVRVLGRIGVDDADRLLADLSRETELHWRQDHSPDDAHLGGISDLLLTAAVSGAVGRSAEVATAAALDRVRAAISRWRDRRLDPPDIDIQVQAPPEDDPGSGPEAEGRPGEAAD